MGAGAAFLSRVDGVRLFTHFKSVPHHSSAGSTEVPRPGRVLLIHFTAEGSAPSCQTPTSPRTDPRAQHPGEHQSWCWKPGTLGSSPPGRSLRQSPASVTMMAPASQGCNNIFIPETQHDARRRVHTDGERVSPRRLLPSTAVRGDRGQSGDLGNQGRTRGFRSNAPRTHPHPGPRPDTHPCLSGVQAHSVPSPVPFSTGLWRWQFTSGV